MRVSEFSGTPVRMRGRVGSWKQMSATLGLGGKFLAFVLHRRDSMQKKIVIKDRVVYRSDPRLRRVQKRIKDLLDPKFDSMPGNGAAMAYRPGVSAVKMMGRYGNAKRLLKTDIRHFYDSISLEHLEKSLTKLGYSPSEGRLLGRYCCVWNGRYHSLQQGSPASPCLANIVGNVYLDAPMLEWLEGNVPEGVEVEYVRYSDNMALVFRTEAPEGFVEGARKKMDEVIRKAGFESHAWSNRSSRSPHHSMSFIGVVLNGDASLPKHRRYRLNSGLFNVAVKDGLFGQLERYTGKKMDGAFGDRESKAEALLESYRLIANGNVTYLMQVNGKHGLEAKKLYEAGRLRLKLWKESGYDDKAVDFGDAWCAEVKRYRNEKEGLDSYMERVRGALGKRGK